MLRGLRNRDSFALAFMAAALVCEIASLVLRVNDDAAAAIYRLPLAIAAFVFLLLFVVRSVMLRSR